MGILALTSADAEPIAVRHIQGATRGFMVIRSESGALLGYGELSQLAQGDRVTARLTYHFRDGSFDDETTVFTQKSTFQFVSDHHIQRGPFFSKPSDISVLASGDVTSRAPGKDGLLKIETSHIDPPNDLSNGMIAVILLNLPPNPAEFQLGMVVPSGKGRLIKLDISPAGQQTFSCTIGFRCRASVFRIKTRLGGIAGVVAPIIGKQPDDIFVWVHQDGVPLIVREVGQLAEGSPIVSIELAGTIFSHPKPASKLSSK